MATIYCTREELEAGVVVPVGERTRIVLRPAATRITLRGVIFDENRAFLFPHALKALRSVGELVQRIAPLQVLVVAHTEPTGDPTTNDRVATARAETAAAWLREDVDGWLACYEESTAAEMRWGAREDRAMLRGLGFSTPNGTKPVAASPNAAAGDAVVRAFQQARGLKDDGLAGPVTRRQLITEYFAAASVRPLPQSDEPGASEQAAEGGSRPELNVVVHGAGGHFPDEVLEPLRKELRQQKAPAPVAESRGGNARLEFFLFDPEGPGVNPQPGAPDGDEYLRWFQLARRAIELDAVGSGRRLFSAELVDALFRTNSAVVLPEGEAPSSGSHEAITGIGVFSSVLRFVDEHPGKSLLIAGHTDTTADVDFNQQLSQERADCALAVLLGDRERFKEIADGRHTVGDTKQILSWCSAAHPDLFACDPGIIDDNEATGTEAVRRFQEQYNAAKSQLGATAEDLAVDGDVGPLTWGAFFDVYQFSIQDELAEDAEEFAVLRAQLVFVDDDRKALGFSEHHPAVRTADGISHQANRRVEFLLFDPGEEPDTALAEQSPELSEIYQPGEYTRVPLDGAYVSVKRALSVMAVHSFFSRGSFFPKPSCIPAIVALRQHLQEQPDLTAIVVGHADPGGSAAGNLELSQLRAEAFVALVVGDEEFFTENVKAVWGLEEVQWLLHNVEAAGAPCYAGMADASIGLRTEAALGAFQTGTAELPISYEDNVETRAALAKHYVQSAEPAPELDSRILTVGVGSSPADTESKSQVHKNMDPDHAAYQRRIDVFFARHRAREKAEELQALPELYAQWIAAADLAIEHEPQRIPIQLLGTDVSPMPNVAFTLTSIDGEGLSLSGTTDAHGFARVEVKPGTYQVEADGRTADASFGPDVDCGVNVYFEAAQDEMAQLDQTQAEG